MSKTSHAGSALALDANVSLAYIANMKAKPLLDDRYEYGDGSFVQAVLWEVPTPVPPSEHNIKYRLVYIVDRERVVGFDNERGKGDHQHIDGVERPYTFSGIRPLLADFESAVENWRMQHGRSKS